MSTTAEKKELFSTSDLPLKEKVMKDEGEIDAGSDSASDSGSSSTSTIKQDFSLDGQIPKVKEEAGTEGRVKTCDVTDEKPGNMEDVEVFKKNLLSTVEVSEEFIEQDTSLRGEISKEEDEAAVLSAGAVTTCDLTDEKPGNMEEVELFEKNLLSTTEVSEEVVNIIIQFGRHQEDIGKMATARTFYMKAIDMIPLVEGLSEKRSKLLPNLHSRVGNISLAAHELDDAVKHITVALVQLNKLHGVDTAHKDKICLMSNLAQAFRAQLKYAESVKYYYKAYMMLKKLNSGTTEEAAQLLQNIGNNLVLMERFDEALTFQMEYNEIAPDIFGSVHSKVAEGLEATGLTLFKMGDKESAAYLKRAKAMFERLNITDRSEVEMLDLLLGMYNAGVAREEKAVQMRNTPPKIAAAKVRMQQKMKKKYEERKREQDAAAAKVDTETKPQSPPECVA